MGAISPPLQLVRERACLKCNQSFRSRGPHNRICPDCHRINAKLGQIPDRVLQKERGQKFHNGELMDLDLYSEF